ncbi:MAG: DUF3368 domain-containing protein [Betaproteobacteria bacterium]|uniref:DUF3368 domain-containing protein n=1 Tax=Candidatus Proximibacter danicus TaxID=2954365 RepID=A0A9D7K2G5_9PROT|nr:DUF3368 domain-containing protein [Candidatus Proximibacter danicus]MBK9444795.1 DUF3368 domain-containing protein [Betaproteobacteria bacterium]
MKRLVVTDTGPLVIFARSGRLDIVLGVAERVIVTETVRRECTANILKPGAVEIAKALGDGRLTTVADVVNPAIEKTHLDPGEKSAIAYAISLPPKDGTLLMDERRGRSVAALHGLAVIGSAGLLVVAKRLELITSVAQVLDDWEKVGYWLDSSVVKTVLSMAGEVPPSTRKNPNRP